MTPPKTLIERIEARIHWNCAFNDPDDDTKLLIESLAYIRAVEAPVDWHETIERIFIRKDF